MIFLLIGRYKRTVSEKFVPKKKKYKLQKKINKRMVNEKFVQKKKYKNK